MAMAEGSDLFLSLPDDAFSLIAAHLSHPRHLLSLALASKRLFSLTLSSSSAWLSLLSSSISPVHLQSWQSLSSLSYVSICRFVFSASKLRSSLWVHQNPELGNLVYPIWGFLSLVFVRIIPQVVSKNVLYAPVFEIHCDSDGKPCLFFLHGENDSIHVGSNFHEIPSDPNVLLLEADFCNSNCEVNNTTLFGKLAFGDRRTLLDLLSSKSIIKLPNNLSSTPIFPKSEQDFKTLSDRRDALISMHKQLNGGKISHSSIRSSLSNSSLNRTKSFTNEKRKNISSLVKDSFLQLIGKTSNSNPSSSNSTGENIPKHLPLNEFLSTSNDSISLSLRVTQMRLTTYRSWPNMHENRYALYKLPLNGSKPDKHLSGLWAGSFGWPPVLPSNGSKPGKALFILLLSYENTNTGLSLIATKVLEGNHYVLHPNGSSMFTAQMEISSEDEFPFEMEMKVKSGFNGEGIASGYGFRYPGSKPGSLFELVNGLVCFVWRESKMVLVLERVELEELVKGGERVRGLNGVMNFAYLTKSYSNVFAGLSSR